MKDQDKKAFREEIEAVMVLYYKDKPTVAVLRQWWNALERYPFEVVVKCLDYHIKHSKFAPLPMDIIKIVAERDGRPSADEAWAICLQQQDEAATVWWTEDVATALGMGAGGILADGDKIAARMAFRDSYTKLIESERSIGVPVKWILSKGHDITQRDEVVKRGLELGYVSQEKAGTLMLGHIEQTGKEVLSIAFEGVAAETETDKEEAREKLQAIREMLK